MKYYLSCLRKENFDIIERHSFSIIGFHENSHIADELEPGDRIIIYVGSRISCFAAVVKAKSKVYWDNKLIWDDIFSKRVKISEYITLNRNDLVDVRDILQELSFIKNKKRFGMNFMSGLRRLPLEDGEKITKIMEYRNGV